MTAFIERLRELSLLEAGWLDGEGLPITQAAQNTAYAFQRFPEAFLYPSPDGGLQIEYGNTEITIVISPEGLVEFFPAPEK